MQDLEHAADLLHKKGGMVAAVKGIPGNVSNEEVGMTDGLKDAAKTMGYDGRGGAVKLIQVC